MVSKHMPTVLQKPVMPEEAYNRAVAANQATYRKFQDVPREAFPLFLTSLSWRVWGEVTPVCK